MSLDNISCSPISVKLCSKDRCESVKLNDATLRYDLFSSPNQKAIIQWEENPKTVLILGKYFDNEPRLYMEQIADWLYNEKHMNVIFPDEISNDYPNYPGHSDVYDFQHKVDFIVAVGGDGTLLFVNSLFTSRVPPVIPFKVGSLAFLAIFDVLEYKNVIQKVIDGGFTTLSRNRLNVGLIRGGSLQEETSHVVLNEVVVDKGSSGSICTLDTFCNGDLITTVMGDGIIIATSTGSTAYNLAAGGSMVHPNVGAMLLTPICPHSLSFRPVLLPPQVHLRIQVPDDARDVAWAQFDGRNKVQLDKLDSIEIHMADYPIPTVCDDSVTNEWFSALARCLHWNVRQRQKAIPKDASL